MKRKYGHTGTLDPNATGVLPILLGQGTKLSKYLVNHDKTYIATIKLGEKTDTADSEGNVIEKKNIEKNNLNEENVKNMLNSFIGKQKQIPPMYSAIKVNGKKLYQYARSGQEVKIEPRDIEIYNIELIKIREDEIEFKVECSKGTYIRSLCEDIAEKLETVGYMKELQRTRVGEFKIEQAVELEDLENNGEKLVISIEEFMKNKKEIKIKDNKIKLYLNGVNLKYEAEDGIYRIYNEENQFLGIGTIKENILKRDIVL